MPTPSISTLITFTAGTTILAAEANQNFSDIRQAYNNHYHSAEDVAPGTFRTGPFVFNGAVTVNGAITGQLDAANLVAGTIPDARFPAVLPAVSGQNLTNLPLPVDLARFTQAQTWEQAQTFRRDSGTDVGAAFRISGDAGTRLEILANGGLAFGNGTDVVDTLLARTGPNVLGLTGRLDAGAITVTNGAGVIAERDLGTVSSTVSVDFSLRNNVRMVLSANVTNLTLSGGANGGVYTMFIEHNGAFTISSWPSNVRWDFGSAPTLTTGANRGSIVSFYFRDGRYHATLVATNLNLA